MDPLDLMDLLDLMGFLVDAAGAAPVGAVEDGNPVLEVGVKGHIGMLGLNGNVTATGGIAGHIGEWAG
jgi:hypothetical protein